MTNIFSSRDSREALGIALRATRMQVRRKKEEPFFLALSGGETAQQMFRLWTERFSGRIDWDTIRFYWVDERCVPPQDSESNYGHAHELLFGPLNILPAHIHRIRGEEEPAAEAVRYAPRGAGRAASPAWNSPFRCHYPRSGERRTYGIDLPGFHISDGGSESLRRFGASRQRTKTDHDDRSADFKRRHAAAADSR